MASSPLLPATPRIGQPPSMEWITLNVLSLVGFWSYVIETWHEPPPWVALPVKARFCDEPNAMELLAPSASYTPDRCLQGKSLPSATRGELLRVDLPYGTGVFIIMCPLERTAIPRIAKVDDEYFMLKV